MNYLNPLSYAAASLTFYMNYYYFSFECFGALLRKISISYEFQKNLICIKIDF